MTSKKDSCLDSWGRWSQTPCSSHTASWMLQWQKAGGHTVHTQPTANKTGTSQHSHLTRHCAEKLAASCTEALLDPPRSLISPAPHLLARLSFHEH